MIALVPSFTIALEPSFKLIGWYSAIRNTCESIQSKYLFAIRNAREIRSANHFVRSAKELDSSGIYVIQVATKEDRLHVSLELVSCNAPYNQEPQIARCQ